MVFPSGDGRGSGSDLISVDTNALKTTAPTFRQSGQQVSMLSQSVMNSVHMANGSIMMVLEFAKMASLLEQLQGRIAEAMQCASGGLQRIGISLEIVSDTFMETDSSARQSFTRLQEDTMPWHLDFTLPTGINTGNTGGPAPQVVPTLTAQSPKIVSAKNPIANQQTQNPIVSAKNPIANQQTPSPIVSAKNPIANPQPPSPIVNAKNPIANPQPPSPTVNAKNPIANPQPPSPIVNAKNPIANHQTPSPIVNAKNPIASHQNQSINRQTQNPIANHQTQNPIVNAKNPIVNHQNQSINRQTQNPIANHQNPIVNPAQGIPILDPLIP